MCLDQDRYNSRVYKERTSPRLSISSQLSIQNLSTTMKFLIVAALVAAVAADSAYPTYPSYKAPAYPSPAYPSPSYPTPAYKSYDYAPQPYSFNYEVKDEYYNNFGHSETSDGKTATGSYHVALPDGRHQTVTYKADDYGYVADVKYDGYAKEYDYKPATYKAAEYKAPAYPAYKAPAYPTYPAPAYKAPAYPEY